MKIKMVWFITITSWLMLIMHIVLPFTGVVKREWDSMVVWITLSTIWTLNLVETLKEKKNNE
jgi:hypothetical protein